MKFIVSSSYLLKQLQVLGSVINSSDTLPILDNFLFELNKKTLTVSSSDLETTMSATLEIESTDKGSVAVVNESPAIPTDLLGNNRLGDTAPDCGAMEFTP